MYELALQHARARDYDQARGAFEELLAAHPHADSKPWISYAQVCALPAVREAGWLHRPAHASPMVRCHTDGEEVGGAHRLRGRQGRLPVGASAWPTSHAGRRATRPGAQMLRTLRCDASGRAPQHLMCCSCPASNLTQAAGLLELEAGQPERAVALLQRAVALQPELAPVLQWAPVRKHISSASAG